jgi:hypothetical protein
LDGETNLKIKKKILPLEKLLPEKVDSSLISSKITLYVENPNENIH